MNVHRNGKSANPQHCVAWVALVAVTAVCGCAPVASLHFADLNFKRLDMSDPLITTVNADACSWAIEGDQIQIGLSNGRIDAESGDRMAMSFVLDGLPTGNEREYRVERLALRCYWHHAREHERFASLNGVVSIKLLPGERLAGRFRIMARKQVFHILTNWTTVGQTLLMGTFTAQQDADTVSSILVQTEKGGMDRSQKGNTIRGSIPRPREVVGPEVN